MLKRRTSVQRPATAAIGDPGALTAPGVRPAPGHLCAPRRHASVPKGGRMQLSPHSHIIKSMKLRCPRCKKVLQIADKYAGRAIRCPACNRAFSVPKLQTALRGPGDRSELDLENLAQLEKQSTQMEGEELVAAQTADADRKKLQTSDPNIRICPNCQKPTLSRDPYAEMLCSNCWTPIPAMIKGAQTVRKKETGPVAADFYSQLASATAYPIPAISSLLTAAGVAFGAGLVPVAVMTAMSNVMVQGENAGYEDRVKADLSGASIMLMGIFAFEIFFFSAVAMHSFLDVIRTTSVGNDRAPNLSWSPSQWSKSLGAYLVLCIYLAIASMIVVYLTMGMGPRELIASADTAKLMEKGGVAFMIGMVLISFAIPMNLIGISLGSVSQGLNPVNVGKSIGRTHVHYIFLVLLLCVYGIMFGTAFWAIVHDWFIPQIAKMSAGSKEGNLMQVAMPLLAWGAVMAFYFYGAFVLARLHGLFARTFRKHLEFGTL
jgi:hypothetical protein